MEKQFKNTGLKMNKRIALVSAIALSSSHWFLLRARPAPSFPIHDFEEQNKSFKKRTKFDQLKQSNRDKGFG